MLTLLLDDQDNVHSRLARPAQCPKPAGCGRALVDTISILVSLLLPRRPLGFFVKSGKQRSSAPMSAFHFPPPFYFHGSFFLAAGALRPSSLTHIVFPTLSYLSKADLPQKIVDYLRLVYESATRVLTTL
jgi:hypothetical protein